MVQTEKLILLRKKNGFTQIKAAEKLQVSRQAISGWETGAVLPSLENLKSLSNLYGVSVDYLLNESPTETAPMEAENRVEVQTHSANIKRMLIYSLAIAKDPSLPLPQSSKSTFLNSETTIQPMEDIMSNLSKNYVMTLLQNYRATKRKIEQLRYELEHPAKVSPDEMIEAMNFTKGDGEGRPSGSVSNKTLYIAMNFQSAADEANAALTHDLVSRLVPLEQEINRLEHYVALLEPRQAEVIRLAYFEGHTWQQISAKTQITTRTLYKIRNQAVEELAEMYALTADLQR